MRFTILLALTLLVAPVVAAQPSFSSRPGVSSGLGIEAVRSADGGAVVSAGFVTARLALSARYALVADVPFAQATYPAPTFGYSWTPPCAEECGRPPAEETSASVGNPYVGLRVQESDAGWYQELGVRLPLGPSPLEAGDMEPVRETLFTRAEAFTDGGIALLALTGFERSVAPYLHVRARAGAVAQLARREGAVLAEGGVEGAWRALRVGATSHLRVGLAESYQVSDGTWGALIGGQAGLQLGRVRPELYVRVPVGEAAQTALGHQLGLTLSVALGR
jgi:hypothetical protein